MLKNTLWMAPILLILVLVPGVLPARGQLPDDRVAVVNGVDIPTAEFEAALQQALLPWSEKDDAPTGAGLQALHREVLTNLIGRRLAYQESRRLGIRVDDDRVDAEMDKLAARFSEATDFGEALHRADLSRSQLRAQLRRDIAIRLLLEDQVLQHVEVDEREIKAFYDSNPNLFKKPAQVKASHIFVAAGPDSSREERSAAVALLRKIQGQLGQGVPFSELALDYSQCPSSQNGGDLGYFDKEKMIKGFADAAFALNPGEVSDIVRTGQGYHLIMVADRQPKMKLTFEDVREPLRRSLKIEKATRQIKEYLQSLRETAEVKIFLQP